MNVRPLVLAALPLALGLGATGADTATEALDAVSAASVVVNAPAVTTTTAKLTFTEPETNGSLRFYYGTASFTAADTAEAALDSIAEESRRWDSLLSDYSRHSMLSLKWKLITTSALKLQRSQQKLQTSSLTKKLRRFVTATQEW